MKAKILTAIKTLLDKLGARNKALDAAKAAYTAANEQVHRLHAKETKARKEADHLRKQGHMKKALAKDRRGDNLQAKRVKAQVRRQRKIAEVKRLTGEVNKIDKDLAGQKAELQKLLSDSKVTISGNKASGGSKRERLKALAIAAWHACASGNRRNFYSQSGAWDVDHVITGEQYGDRSDCSSFVTSVYKGAGLSDPNDNHYGGGYTGTLAAHGKVIEERDIKPGDLILYGTNPFHHVEMFVGPGSRTIGHGSSPVDPGVIHLLPGPIQIRTYV